MAVGECQNRTVHGTHGAAPVFAAALKVRPSVRRLARNSQKLNSIICSSTAHKYSSKCGKFRAAPQRGTVLRNSQLFIDIKRWKFYSGIYKSFAKYTQNAGRN
jgi:hypothetical protein